jgi:hypothetical protein
MITALNFQSTETLAMVYHYKWSRRRHFVSSAFYTGLFRVRKSDILPLTCLSVQLMYNFDLCYSQKAHTKLFDSTLWSSKTIDLIIFKSI